MALQLLRRRERPRPHAGHRQGTLLPGALRRVHATNQDAFTPGLLDLYARSFAKPSSLDASFAYYRALNETVRRNAPLAARRLPMPILAVGGGGHGGFGDAQAEQVRRYADDVTGVSLPGCSHWVPEEAPDRVDPLLLAFLRAG